MTQNESRLQEELAKWREWAIPIACGWKANVVESDEQLREKILLVIARLHEENVRASLQ